MPDFIHHQLAQLDNIVNLSCSPPSGPELRWSRRMFHLQFTLCRPRSLTRPNSVVISLRLLFLLTPPSVHTSPPRSPPGKKRRFRKTSWTGSRADGESGIRINSWLKGWMTPRSLSQRRRNKAAGVFFSTYVFSRHLETECRPFWRRQLDGWTGRRASLEMLRPAGSVFLPPPERVCERRKMQKDKWRREWTENIHRDVDLAGILDLVRLAASESGDWKYQGDAHGELRPRHRL